MSSTFFKSSSIRQLLGAAGGMLVAGAVYVVVQQLSSFSMTQALLVSSPTISENAGKVVVNDRRVIDDQSFRRIATQTRTVAAALRQQQTSAASSSQAAAVTVTSRSPAPVYISTQEATQRQRIQFRNDVAAAQRAGNGAPVAPSSVPENVVAPIATSSALSVSSRGEGAPQEQRSTVVSDRPRGLPNSGFALDILVVSSLLFSLVSLRWTIGRRSVAGLRHAQ